jgi:nucleoside phosphorylase
VERVAGASVEIQPSVKVQLVILTALPIEAAEVRAYSDDPTLMIPLTDTLYDVFDYAAPKGKTIRTGLVSVGPGNIAAAIEVGKLSISQPDAILLFVGIAGALKDLEIGDVIAAREIIYIERAKVGSAGRLFRPKMGTCTSDLVQLASKISGDGIAPYPHLSNLAKPPKRVVVGQIASGEELLKLKEYRDEISLTVSDAIAFENEGYGFVSAARGRMHSLVVRGISDSADEAKVDDAQQQAAAGAAAFAWSIVDLMAAAGDVLPPPVEPKTAPLPAIAYQVPPEKRAVEWVDKICSDEDLVFDDDPRQIEDLAGQDYMGTDPAFFELLLRNAVGRVDESQTWSTRRLRRYVRECARAWAHECTPGGDIAHHGDFTISRRFPVGEILRTNPLGAAIAFSVPEAFECLDQADRRRTLSGLVGTQSSPRVPTVVALQCLAALRVSNITLSEEERQRLLDAVQRSPYTDIRDAQVPLTLVLPKVTHDLKSRSERGGLVLV